MQEYNNEFFSIKYPSAWEYEEEYNNMYESTPGLTKGVRCTFYNPNQDPDSLYHAIIVQKSAMYKVYDTPEEWRDLSVSLQSVNDQYLGPVEHYMLDSLQFGPYPAAMAGFVVANFVGDSLKFVV